MTAIHHSHDDPEHKLKVLCVSDGEGGNPVGFGSERARVLQCEEEEAQRGVAAAQRLLPCDEAAAATKPPSLHWVPSTHWFWFH